MQNKKEGEGRLITKTGDSIQGRWSNNALVEMF